MPELGRNGDRLPRLEAELKDAIVLVAGEYEEVRTYRGSRTRSGKSLRHQGGEGDGLRSWQLEALRQPVTPKEHCSDVSAIIIRIGTAIILVKKTMIWWCHWHRLPPPTRGESRKI